MDTLGSEEPDWNCTLKDGSGYLQINDTDADKCEQIKECSELNPIVSIANILNQSNFWLILYKLMQANEFYSVRAKFQLICDNDYVPLIQIIMAGGSVRISPFSPFSFFISVDRSTSGRSYRRCIR